LLVLAHADIRFTSAESEQPETRTYTLSIKHPWVCRITLSNPSCLTVSVNEIETWSYTFVSFNVL